MNRINLYITTRPNGRQLVRQTIEELNALCEFTFVFLWCSVFSYHYSVASGFFWYV
jgi:hypothetical protein